MRRRWRTSFAASASMRQGLDRHSGVSQLIVPNQLQAHVQTTIAHMKRSQIRLR